MNKSEILNLVNDISTKFSNINLKANVELQCEVLHASILAIYADFTQKQYEEQSLVFRKTLEKLDVTILKYVSVEYRQSVEDLYKNSSVFAKDKPKKDVKVITEVKTKIGFIKEELEI